eukprot:CAMPEP_0196651388 /NCGR_PEP_ID=MMETSP1086-20130531/244_1 /TAXON_ID=77921 /ORGANISM="Cyanoptyche  gloeocystis , Strain SAG4.97" /LENGTH=256 /DNA_ID=CAMNT_0041981345 /DNA_START=53 /DNA_END=823 /DNA_ORIENTATION=+
MMLGRVVCSRFGQATPRPLVSVQQRFLKTTAKAKLKKPPVFKGYEVDEAVRLVKANALAKFDETVDVAINLNIDPKQTLQHVRGFTQLPHGTGKKIVVAVFARGDKALEAKAAGADIIGDEALLASIKDGKITFDKCIATPDMMPSLGKVAPILGPRGLMPSPKMGTVTNAVADAVRAVKAGKVDFKSNKGGVVQAPVGKASFAPEALAENVTTLISALVRSKPSAVKGEFFKQVFLNSTMGPAVPLDISSMKLAG